MRLDVRGAEVSAPTSALDRDRLHLRDGKSSVHPEA